MAKAIYHVVYDLQDSGLGLTGLRRELSKAEAEELDPKLKEVSNVFGPVNVAKVIEVEAETSAQAAILAKRVVAGAGGINNKFVCVKTTEWKEETPI